MLRFLRRTYPVCVLLFLVFLPGKGFADETIKSKYFNISISDGIGRAGLMEKLNAGYFLRRNAAYFRKKEAAGANLNGPLAEALDAIYLKVSDIIDIHMYNLTIGLCIVADKTELSDTLESCISRRPDAPSFYYSDKDIIYISFKDMDPGMLAHEISHAIVAHYFAVVPPEKIQEVIAGYAEYSIRKLISGR